MKPLNRSPLVARLLGMMMGIWLSTRQALGRPAAALVLSLILLPGVIYLLAETLRKPSTFHIVADTEVLDMVTTGVSATRWYIEEGSAVLGSADPLGDNPGKSFAFRGLAEIGPRSNIRMVRYGNGPLQLTLLDGEQIMESAQGSGRRASRAIPVVTLENLLFENSTWHWAEAAALKVHIGELPFSGSLLAVGAIGSETYVSTITEPPPVLTAGRVVVMEKRLLSDLRYPVMELDLQLGDEVTVLDAKGKPADTACVFSVASMDAPGIKVACHVTGKTLQISRFGGHLVEMKPGPWDMILAEPTLQVMVPLLFSIIYVLFQWLLNPDFPRDNRFSKKPPGY